MNLSLLYWTFTTLDNKILFIIFNNSLKAKSLFLYFDLGFRIEV